MKDKYGNKIGICKCGCTKEEKPLYAKGLLQGCYWESRRKITESKERKPREAKNYKPIRKVSAKMQKALSIYRPIKHKYLQENLKCEVINCNNKSQDLHHKARRGKNLCNIDTFMAVCRSCHIHIESNPIESKKLGYILHS